MLRLVCEILFGAFGERVHSASYGARSICSRHLRIISRDLGDIFKPQGLMCKTELSGGGARDSKFVRQEVTLMST